MVVADEFETQIAVQIVRATDQDTVIGVGKGNAASRSIGLPIRISSKRSMREGEGGELCWPSATIVITKVIKQKRMLLLITFPFLQSAGVFGNKYPCPNGRGWTFREISKGYVAAIVLLGSRLWSSALRQIAHWVISTGAYSGSAGQTCRVISSPGRPQAQQQ
jgi:hypothetical protein